jgi:hypothetical protein
MLQAPQPQATGGLKKGQTTFSIPDSTHMVSALDQASVYFVACFWLLVGSSDSPRACVAPEKG